MVLLQIPTPPAPPDLPPWMINSGPPLVVYLIPIVALIVGGIVLYPLLRALARRIEHKISGGAQEDIEELRGRVTMLEEQAMRIPELEERVDFAERLLAKAGDANRLKEG
jgi:hypothetical protein